MSNYNAKRLDDLENNVNDIEYEVTGDGAIVITNVGGWTKKTFPNGQIEASTTLDYTLTQEDMDIATFSWNKSENIPVGIFNNYPTIDAQCIDISTDTTNRNSMVVARKTLPSQTNTGIFTFQALQLAWGTNGYGVPNKIQVVWIAKGN